MSPLVRGCYGIFHILNCNYSYISTRHVKNKLYKGNCFTVPALWKSTTQKQNVDIKKDKTTDNATFEKMIESRREEASRSILVQVHSEQSCDDLHKYCSQYGEVHSMHHYSLPGSLV
ncbi:hypothetical protein C0J52_28246 [Blattella germanica]|nr:hypothetical protein C0J52_28246 [Blattella germanica]